MRYFKTPTILPKIFQSFWWRLPQETPTIFLTFDDGPIPELTPFVLETLKYYKAQATFFCVGDNIRKHSSIFRTILQENHQVGNHTYHHLDAWKARKSEYLADIQLCQNIMQEKKVENTLFRPPYGKLPFSFRKKIEKDLQIVLWDVLSYDFDSYLNRELCLQHTIQCTENGSIVVFHDNIKATRNLIYVLPRFLEHFTEKGFQFAKLPSVQTKTADSSL